MTSSLGTITNMGCPNLFLHIILAFVRTVDYVQLIVAERADDRRNYMLLPGCLCYENALCCRWSMTNSEFPGLRRS